MWCCQVPCAKLASLYIHCCVVLPDALYKTGKPLYRLLCGVARCPILNTCAQAKLQEQAATGDSEETSTVSIDLVPSFVTGELGGRGGECLYTCYDPVSQDLFLCTSLSCANEMCELLSFIVWGVCDIVRVDRLDPQMAEAGLVCA